MPWPPPRPTGKGGKRVLLRRALVRRGKGRHNNRKTRRSGESQIRYIPEQRGELIEANVYSVKGIGCRGRMKDR